VTKHCSTMKADYPQNAPSIEAEPVSVPGWSQSGRQGAVGTAFLYLRPPVVVFDADDVVLAEIAAGLDLDQAGFWPEFPQQCLFSSLIQRPSGKSWQNEPNNRCKPSRLGFAQPREAHGRLFDRLLQLRMCPTIISLERVEPPYSLFKAFRRLHPCDPIYLAQEFCTLGIYLL
jgi:hypothetical protein